MEAAEQQRDLLADISEAIGDQTVPCNDLPARLARLAPNWRPYKSLTGKQLREELKKLGVKVPSTGNRYPVSPDLVREAIACREDVGEPG